MSVLKSPPSAIADLGAVSQWVLMRRRFMRHRVAVASLAVVGLLYLIALFAEFIAPVDPEMGRARYTYAPPQAIHLFYRNAEGDLSWRPHVLDYRVTIEPEAMRRVFEPDPAKPIDLRLFPRVEPYEMLGFIPMERKLFGPVESGKPLYLFGADRLGRDMFSRTVHGARVSLSIGLLGVVASLVLGVLIGGISGYMGGRVDGFVQRLIDVIRSLPTIPLWLGLAAAVPREWGALTTYFVITLLLSLIGWTELARVVRGRFLTLKSEDYVTAALLDGCSKLRVILRHMLPAFASHVIATATLAVPAMILAETALSFLGLGLQAPIVSWGVLLQEAQNIRSVAAAPWLFIPGAAVVVAVLAMNFLGDGMRDAADPYNQ